MPSLVDGICELALETSDRRRLEAFYTAVLGFRVLSRDHDRTWLACGSRARLGLWDPGEKEFGDEGGRHVHFAFSAAPGALAVLARRLETLGIEHRGPLEHDGGDRSLYVEDPAGNVVEFWDFFGRGRTVSALATDGEGGRELVADRDVRGDAASGRSREIGTSSLIDASPDEEHQPHDHPSSSSNITAWPAITVAPTSGTPGR
jgi:catechol 2,3-dioxygenase-like lactoylglutathione lyase family enzyme